MDQGYDEDVPTKKVGKQHNILPLWGNEATMNLNPLILTNIQSSSYFKVSLFKLKTYHEVVDEIYYQVKHLEPWERGSRKTAGQTGMCGGVRGVGAGGIVSTAFCLLYKLYTLRLTRKQVNGLLTHTDSPYIRALGFMYIRYTQPPADLYDWYEEYLQDEEEIDVKAGGGQANTTTIGQMLRQLLVKLDWFSTLFPRIPVPIQKSIEKRLEEYSRKHNLDNRLTFAEKEMNRRRGEERELFDSGNNGGAPPGGNNAGNGNTGGGYRGSGGGGGTDRDYYDEQRSSSVREREPNRTYERERDDRQGHSRSNERSNYRSEYRDVSGREREKDYHNRDRDRYAGRGGGGGSESYRDRDREREYSREDYRSAERERDRGRYSSSSGSNTSKHKERDRKYR